MGDRFDPYREALVVERKTVWPNDLPEIPPDQRQPIEDALHADPQQAGELAYVRLHAGFCRQITVTPEDLQRVMQPGGST